MALRAISYLSSSLEHRGAFSKDMSKQKIKVNLFPVQNGLLSLP